MGLFGAITQQTTVAAYLAADCRLYSRRISGIVAPEYVTCRYSWCLSSLPERKARILPQLALYVRLCGLTYEVNPYFLIRSSG